MKQAITYDRIFTCNTKYCKGDVQLKIVHFMTNDRICPVLIPAPTKANADRGWMLGETLLRLAVNTDIDPQNDKCFWLKSYAENEGVDDFLFGYNIARPTGRTQTVGHGIELKECMLMPEELWFLAPAPGYLDTVPTQENLVQEIEDLISELDQIVNDMRGADPAEEDFEGFAEDLETQSGSVETIVKRIREFVQLMK